MFPIRTDANSPGVAGATVLLIALRYLESMSFHSTVVGSFFRSIGMALTIKIDKSFPNRRGAAIAPLIGEVMIKR
jgi:hypothetical protein